MTPLGHQANEFCCGFLVNLVRSQEVGHPCGPCQRVDVLELAKVYCNPPTETPDGETTPGCEDERRYQCDQCSKVWHAYEEQKGHITEPINTVCAVFFPCNSLGFQAKDVCSAGYCEFSRIIEQHCTACDPPIEFCSFCGPKLHKQPSLKSHIFQLGPLADLPSVRRVSVSALLTLCRDTISGCCLRLLEGRVAGRLERPNPR